MESLEAELARARDLDVADLADAIESIGFECTRCGACCKAEDDDPHTATVFPDEVREIQSADDGEYDWRDVARPMPYGLEEKDGEAADDDESDGDAEPANGGADGSDADGGHLTGETFEWALQTTECGDCTFYEEAEDGTGACSVHDDRPLICATYPFSVALAGTSQPMGEAVDEAGMVRAHECEGLGRDISRTDAEELAATLKERAVRELEEAIDVRDAYAPVDAEDRVVVHDSEGAKSIDGAPIEE
ncbi:YkgJ family cysteine cluster protein [Natronoarchaeum mannanilyticum]|uniref:YkgJ family cysteine cluster protein n=1 Tax=Natronoarchaeum mannanilyticum TaxID=926360 RepID=A0AAV3T3Y5_9EURY